VGVVGVVAGVGGGVGVVAGVVGGVVAGVVEGDGGVEEEIVVEEEVCRYLLKMAYILWRGETTITDYSEDSIRHFQLKINLIFFIFSILLCFVAVFNNHQHFFISFRSLWIIFYLNRITF